MKSLTKDARGFVTGVMQYLAKEQKGSSSLPKVQALFRKVSTAAAGEKHVVVGSAVELTAGEKSSLKSILYTQFGQEVELTCQVKPELLGGLRIQKGDWIFDATLLRQLEDLQRAIT